MTLYCPQSFRHSFGSRSTAPLLRSTPFNPRVVIRKDRTRLNRTAKPPMLDRKPGARNKMPEIRSVCVLRWLSKYRPQPAEKSQRAAVWIQPMAMITQAEAANSSKTHTRNVRRSFILPRSRPCHRLAVTGMADVLFLPYL